MLADVALIRSSCRRIYVEHAESSVEQLANRGSGARAAPLVDLTQQAGADAFRHLPAFGPAGTSSVRYSRLFEFGSTPAETRTRSAPDGSSSMVPRDRALRFSGSIHLYR